MATVGLMLTFLLLCCPLLFGRSQAESLGKFGEMILHQGNSKGITDIRKILLNPTSGVLYLGTKNEIVAMDTTDLTKEPRKITWNVQDQVKKVCLMKGKPEAECHNFILLLEFLEDGRVYVCGTYAYDPKCAFLEPSSFTLEKTAGGEVKMESGQGKCPYDPKISSTALMADGILYTGSTTDLMGIKVAISRGTGPVDKRIKTEDSSFWLNAPKFVSSAFVAHSPDKTPSGEDDHIFFFFTENALEYNPKKRVSRVARICKSDVGGKFALSGFWTTFVKAQLVCEDKARHLNYDIITDVTTQQHTPGDPSSTNVYALFTSLGNPDAGTALCVFSPSEINKALSGAFKEVNQACPGFTIPDVPKPRPGQCINNEARKAGYSTSKDIPTPTLNYLLHHVLMENSVTAAPLFVRKGIVYTKLAVTPMKSQKEQRAAVLHLGTDDGELHRVSIVDQKVNLLQEIHLFPHEPIKHILLYQNWALVGSAQSLARVQADGCALITSCELCAEARELGCVWSTKTKACILTEEDPGEGDVVDAALKKCVGQKGRCNPPITNLKVPLGLHVFLPCLQLTTRPCSWVHPPQAHTKQYHSHLEVTVSNRSLGKYVCTCLEGGNKAEEPKPCQYAAYQLIQAKDGDACLASPLKSEKQQKGRQQMFLAAYIFSFGGALLLVACVLFIIRRRRNSCNSYQMAENAASSEMRQDLWCSTASPQLNRRSATPPSRHIPVYGYNPTCSNLNLPSEPTLPDWFDLRCGEQERTERREMEWREREVNEGVEVNKEPGNGLREDAKGPENGLPPPSAIKSSTSLDQ